MGQPKLESRLHGVPLAPPPARVQDLASTPVPSKGQAQPLAPAPSLPRLMACSLFHKSSSVSFLRPETSILACRVCQRVPKGDHHHESLMAERGGVAQERAWGDLGHPGCTAHWP